MEKLIQRLTEILDGLEGNKLIINEVKELLKSLIEDVSNSKCENGDFCGMDKKW